MEVEGGMIDEKKLESALTYLAESEQAYADAKGNAAWLEEQKSIVRAETFKQAISADITVALADAIARTDAKYRETVDKLKDAITAETLLRAKRDRAAIIVEVWRSQNASRRVANV